jgi:hypothetical protein
MCIFLKKKNQKQDFAVCSKEYLQQQRPDTNPYKKLPLVGCSRAFTCFISINMIQ